MWLTPNGFQDRLVMTASIPLRGARRIVQYRARSCQVKSENTGPRGHSVKLSAEAELWKKGGHCDNILIGAVDAGMKQEMFR